MAEENDNVGLGGDIVYIDLKAEAEALDRLPQQLRQMLPELPGKYSACEMERIWEEFKAKNPWMPQVTLLAILVRDFTIWASGDYEKILEEAEQEYDEKVLERKERGDEPVAKLVRPSLRQAPRVPKQLSRHGKGEDWEYDPYKIHGSNK